MTVDKVIVTNVSALKAKYGDKYSRVQAAIQNLVKHDEARGLQSKLVAIDSHTDMKRARGRAVSGAADQRGAKEAIDAIHKHFHPDYILILGAPDIVPHVHLMNPMAGTPDDDDDRDVPSDVPYACAAGWSRRPQHFIGPTRVIGRLPDLVGATDPAYLIKLLDSAATFTARDRSAYSSHFAVSAKVWRKSTTESVANLFGEGAAVFTSPPSGPKWTKSQLAPKLHFINCHGDTISPKFFGEFPKDTFFDAHDAAHLPGRVTKGSVVAAECCYGAELYEPEKAGGQMGIANTYLAQGGYGFLGSTNIAYGPSEGQGQADLICQYFIESVMKGASLGRAALEARQRFVAQFSHVDPSDLKTAVQFILLGDPSVQPIKQVAHAFSRSRVVERAVKTGTLRPEARAFRRERLVRAGTNLSNTVGAAVPTPAPTPPTARQFLLRAATESGIHEPTLKTYRVSFPSTPGRAEMADRTKARRHRLIHLAIGAERPRRRTGPAVTAIIITTEAGHIVHVRRVHSR